MCVRHFRESVPAHHDVFGVALHGRQQSHPVLLPFLFAAVSFTTTAATASTIVPVVAIIIPAGAAAAAAAAAVDRDKMAAPVHAAGQEQASRAAAAAEDRRRCRAEVHGQDGRGKLQTTELGTAAGAAVAVIVIVILRLVDQAGNLQPSGLEVVPVGSGGS